MRSSKTFGLPLVSRRDVKPWERQCGESLRAFAAFVEYREQGGARSYRAVGQKLSKSTTLIKRWGGRWRWLDRVSAWERDLEHGRMVARRKAILEMNDRHAMIAEVMQKKISDGLHSMSDADVAELSPADLAKLLAVSVAVERSSRGLNPNTKLAAVEEPEIPERPVGDEVSDIVKQLSVIDRELLRNISLKYFKIFKMEAELSSAATAATTACEPPPETMNRE
jgi:hypothetical protein